MREAFENFAENGFWFWTAIIVISAAVGYVVNLYWDMTWGIIHGIVTLLIGGLIYGISKPTE